MANENYRLICIHPPPLAEPIWFGDILYSRRYKKFFESLEDYYKQISWDKWRSLKSDKRIRYLKSITKILEFKRPKHIFDLFHQGEKIFILQEVANFIGLLQRIKEIKINCLGK